MGLSAEILDAMVESGCTAEQIAAVVKASLRKRASGAERQARYRARKRDESDAGDVTERNVTPPPSSSSPPTPPLTTPTPDITPHPPTGDALPADRGDEIEQARIEWNRLAEQCGLKSVRRLNPARKAAVGARLREEGLDGWRRVLAQIRGSPFLQGKNDRGWRATFDFAVSDRGYTRISEEHYADCPSVIQPKEWSVTDFLRDEADAEQYSAHDADDVPRLFAVRR